MTTKNPTSVDVAGFTTYDYKFVSSLIPGTAMSGRITADNLILASQRALDRHSTPIVVKLGGSAMEDESATRAVLEAASQLHRIGVRLALVHGGGKPIDRAMAATGLTPKKVAGRRFTDDATLEIVVRVLGELNQGLVNDLGQLGVASVGYTELASFPIHGRRLLLPGLDLQPIDLGRVGMVTSVDLNRLDLGRGIPVLPSLAVDVDGGWLNVNADTVASGLAAAIHADTVVFLTDTPGVLADLNDPQSVIPRLTRTEASEWIADGRIGGGMIPKVEACFEALDAGVSRAVILDGRFSTATPKANSLWEWFVGTSPVGTEIAC